MNLLDLKEVTNPDLLALYVEVNEVQHEAELAWLRDGDQVYEPRFRPQLRT